MTTNGQAVEPSADRLLKKTMRRYLPDDILYRAKQGFVTPIADWLRGPLAREARAIGTSRIHRRASGDSA